MEGYQLLALGLIFGVFAFDIVSCKWRTIMWCSDCRSDKSLPPQHQGKGLPDDEDDAYTTVTRPAPSGH